MARSGCGSRCGKGARRGTVDTGRDRKHVVRLWSEKVRCWSAARLHWSLSRWGCGLIGLENPLGDGQNIQCDGRAASLRGGQKDAPASSVGRGDGVVDDDPHGTIRRRQARRHINVRLMRDRAGETQGRIHIRHRSQILQFGRQSLVQRVIQEDGAADVVQLCGARIADHGLIGVRRSRLHRRGLLTTGGRRRACLARGQDQRRDHHDRNKCLAHSGILTGGIIFGARRAWGVPTGTNPGASGAATPADATAASPSHAPSPVCVPA